MDVLSLFKVTRPENTTCKASVCVLSLKKFFAHVTVHLKSADCSESVTVLWSRPSAKINKLQRQLLSISQLEQRVLFGFGTAMADLDFTYSSQH